MTRLIKILAIPIALLAAGGGAWWFWTARADTRPALRTQTVTVGSIEDTVSAVGTLPPLNSVDVGTQVSGQLQEIKVDYGDRGEKGKLLDEIDHTVFPPTLTPSQHRNHD